MARFMKFVFCGALFALMVSCSSYDQLLKGRDYEAKYEYGLKYYEIGKDTRAMALLAQVEQIYDGTDKADTIKFYLAELVFRQAYYEESASMFDEFRKNYTRSEFIEEAEYFYALSYYNLAPNYELDQGPTQKAIVAFAEYANRYPDSERSQAADSIINELQGRIVSKAFYVGETYFNIGYYNSAITTLKDFVKTYPNAPQREEALYLITKANYLFARNSIESKKRERYYNTIDAGYNFRTEFDDSKHSAEVNRMVNNAEKLSRGQVVLEKAGDDSHLTEKQILRSTKYHEKLMKKVDEGKLTEGEAEKMAADELQNAKDRALKRYKRQGGEDGELQISSSIVNPIGGAQHQKEVKQLTKEEQIAQELDKIKEKSFSTEEGENSSATKAESEEKEGEVVENSAKEESINR